MHGVLAASSSSDSATAFWAALGGVTGLVLIALALIGLWLTFTARLRRQLLLYTQSPPVSLLTGTPDSARQDLQILYRGVPLADPYVVRVRLRTRCRKDILSSDFDQGKPIALDLGVPIVAKLGAETGPGSIPIPPISVEGSAIEIGPALLRKRQTITITALTDGRNPRLKLTNPLGDVTGRAEDYEYPKEQVDAATYIALGFQHRPPRDE